MKLQKGMKFKVHKSKLTNHLQVEWRKWFTDDYMYCTLWCKGESPSKDSEGIRIEGAKYGPHDWNLHGAHNWQWIYENAEPWTPLEEAIYVC